ncbi:MAG: restriction endonuclease subunit S [Pseudomonadota bacterium]
MNNHRAASSFLLRNWSFYACTKESGRPWPRSIPQHWQVVRLKRVAQIRYGLGEPPPELSDGIPIIRATNVERGRINEKGMMFVDPQQVPSQRDAILRQDDIIVVRSGAYTGDSALIPLEYEGAVAGYDMVVRAKTCNARFLSYTLLSLTILHHQIDLCRLRAAQPHLNAEELGNCLLILPTIAEQLSIVKFLNSATAKIDALIAKKQRLIELLNEKRAAIISHAVTKGLYPNVPMKDSGIEWLGEIPVHWKACRLKHVAETGLKNGLFKTKDQFGRGVKLVNVVDMYRDDFLVDLENLERVEAGTDEIDAYKVRDGDIFFVRSSLKMEGVGSSALVYGVVENTVFECHLVKASPVAKLVLPLYLVNYLNSALVRQRLVALAETTTMTTIAQPKLAALEVLLPPLEEQVMLVEFLNEVSRNTAALVTKVRKSIQQLIEYRTALISAAVTGKIDVRNHNLPETEMELEQITEA